MKPHERRQAQAYPYYKLATFDTRSVTFRDGKQAHASEAAAKAAATKPGRYRISEITDNGRRDLEPFEVTA
jgi:hypothetical protein